MDFLSLLPRAEESGAVADACPTGNEYDGRLGLRISSIFVIMIGSSLGALFPVWARPQTCSSGSRSRPNVPPWAFFIAKYFGSGVIVATAFIHLLAPAEEALRNPCLTGPITEYPWVEAIMLMTIIILFFIELMVMRFARFGQSEKGKDVEHDHHAHAHVPDQKPEPTAALPLEEIDPSGSHFPGKDHLGHTRDHASDHSSTTAAVTHTHTHTHTHDHHIEDYSAQLTSIFILEFGIIFHSVFIGLTLAVAGEEFTTLYIVLVFHQTFEGLGLGARLADIPWPSSKRLTPYLLALGFGLSTPIAIAIGLGVRNTYASEGRTVLIINGVFDSISAGILVYTALVELMAHEFMFSTTMRRAPVRTMLAAFGLLCLGATLMALLGKWA
ncbi:hypothetical protein AJ80_00316 [Polytolypa hystricis UAMH7299]|uniref:Uncharacterized protein n=1 Tax=Polytolypa hystricis (strain UAMH7299) TaxID=1447883 RepID=A0A2B7Z3S9_POLH7|nr:hypothetical protein AJ80_00316 [Polytolypa hystricis UAMH7299]